MLVSMTMITFEGSGDSDSPGGGQSCWGGIPAGGEGGDVDHGNHHARDNHHDHGNHHDHDHRVYDNKDQSSQTVDH